MTIRFVDDAPTITIDSKVNPAPSEDLKLAFPSGYITIGDIDAGTKSNTAKVTGTPPSGPSVTDTDTATVPLPQAPGIDLHKAGVFNDLNSNGRADTVINGLRAPRPATVSATVTVRLLASTFGAHRNLLRFESQT